MAFFFGTSGSGNFKVLEGVLFGIKLIFLDGTVIDRSNGPQIGADTIFGSALCFVFDLEIGQEGNGNLVQPQNPSPVQFGD